MKNTYDLEPIFSTQKSFYGKAKVVKNNQELQLYSYNTLVAKINNKTYHYLGKFSKTTTKHQKEFFKQNGLPDTLVKKLMRDNENKIII